MNRIPTNYSKIKNLPNIDGEDLLNIELKAKVLSLDECFDYLMLDRGELAAEEVNICERVHKRGLKKGLGEAVDNLFKQMTVRGGTEACLQYLKAFSGTFQVEATPSGSKSGFSFTVVTTPDDSTTEAA